MNVSAAATRLAACACWPIMGGVEDHDSLPTRVRSLRLWNSSSLRQTTELVHDHHVMLLPLRGCLEAILDGRLLAVTPGQVVAIAAGLPHGLQSTRRRGPVFVVIGWWGGPAPVSGLHADPGLRLRGLAEWALDLIGDGLETEHLLARHLVASLALATATHVEPVVTGYDDPIVDSLCREMAAKPEAPITLADLALLAGCSPQQVTRRFRQAVGDSPMAWFQAKRLEMARQLLAAGEHPPAEVARRCGYQHLRNLQRALRAEVRGR